MSSIDFVSLLERIAGYGETDCRRRGDHELNPHYRITGPLQPAAVLIPLVDRPEGPTALFTKRTDNLAHHPGQVSFPGGHVEEHDATPEETALRETEEEVGISRRHITVIGRIDPYVTGTGFEVTPVVGLVKPPFDIHPDPTEVAEVFEVPLAFLLDVANHQRITRVLGEIRWYAYAMPYDGYHIWGATAGMVRTLYEIVADHET